MQVHSALQFFQQAGMPVEINQHFKIDKEIIRQLREVNYEEKWQLALENKWFHIKLDDQSLFQFDDTSFHYLCCPYEVEPFRDFKKKLSKNEQSPAALDEMYNDALMTAPTKKTPFTHSNGYRCKSLCAWSSSVCAPTLWVRKSS